MSRTPAYTRQFEKDIKRAKKRGKSFDKLKEIIEFLIACQPLPERHRDHKLTGNYQGRRECHIEPDWLLIYQVTSDEIICERCGSHSDLFD